jgi:hypothetical protein
MTLSEIRDAFYEYVEWHGATHGIDPSGIECPQDDTCECEFKPFNDRINEAYRALDELAKADALDARPQTWQPDVDGLVNAVMAREHAASGKAVFLDSVIVRGLIERHLTPADPPVSEGEHSTCATKETPETPDGIPPQPREPETPRDLNIGAWPKPKGESGDQRSRRLDPGRGRFRG